MSEAARRHVRIRVLVEPAQAYWVDSVRGPAGPDLDPRIYETSDGPLLVGSAGAGDAWEVDLTLRDDFALSYSIAFRSESADGSGTESLRYPAGKRRLIARIRFTTVRPEVRFTVEWRVGEPREEEPIPRGGGRYNVAPVDRPGDPARYEPPPELDDYLLSDPDPITDEAMETPAVPGVTWSIRRPLPPTPAPPSPSPSPPLATEEWLDGAEGADPSPPVEPLPARLPSRAEAGAGARGPFTLPAHYRVWYATNRRPQFDASGRLAGYSAERAEEVSYGACTVFLPKGHRIGSVGPPWWKGWFLRLIRRSDALVLERIDPYGADGYWRAVADAAAAWKADERCGMVFLHGYNVSFPEAAIRAAQFGFDLQVRGPVGFFSWPSHGSLEGYAADEAAIEASEGKITRYLLDFAARSGVERVHVIAHSMGNRGLLRAIQRVVAGAAERSPARFRHFVLAAPDVDRDVFLELAALYAKVAHRTTLYVSDRDRALQSSRMLRLGAHRAGLAPPVTVVPGIDTIHVANVDVTLMGHGYVAEAREVLADIHQLLHHDAPPEKRMGLRRAEEDGRAYWVVGR